MPITTFEFDALRGVGAVELRVLEGQRVYALFGSNGVGKTKCLEALFQFQLFTNKDFLNARTHVLRSDIFVARRYATSGGGQFEVPAAEYFEARSLHGTNEIARHSLPVVFLGAGRRSHIENASSHSDPVGTFAERQAKYFALLCSGMQSNFSSLGMHTGLQQWFVTLAQSSNPYQKQADNRKIEIDTLLQLLHQVDDRFDPTFMEIAGDNRVFLKIREQVTELQHLSSGFASLLKMLQAIISGYANFTNEVQLANVKGVVLIDEIESHLHVGWQSKIVLLLKRLFPNTTFYIATHSPLVLTQLEEGEAYQLHRDDHDGVVRARMITAPNKQALIDVLQEGFGVDLNALKRQRMSAESQQLAKKRLFDLINDGGAAT